MAGTADYGDGKIPVTVDPTAWFGRTYSPPNALDVGTIMTQVGNQITSYLTQVGLGKIALYIWPNYDLDLWWSGGAAAFVLVAYRGATLSKPLNTNKMLQERTLEFDIFVLARQVSWAVFSGLGSPFILVDAVEAALTGFRPHGCYNSYFVDERFSEQDPEGRVWLYKMSYRVPTLRVEIGSSFNLANLAEVQALVAAMATQTVGNYVVSNNGLTLPTNNIVLLVQDIATGFVYTNGLDYTYDALNGALTLIADGKLQSGANVKVTISPIETTTTTGQ